MTGEWIAPTGTTPPACYCASCGVMATIPVDADGCFAAAPEGWITVRQPGSLFLVWAYCPACSPKTKDKP